ncbi:MAG: RNA polymerase sigma factor [Tannerella sp.]|nr:RNA polymerase sigma factor [Tannerella sp.]
MNGYTDIIQGVRQSETQAQMAFYDMFARTTYRSAFAVAGNSDEAEEIMQDCILKVLTTVRLLHAEAGAMRRILCRMAVNRAIDAMRRRKDFLVAVETCDCIDCEDESTEPDAPDIDDIRDGIGRLPDLYRAVVMLRLFEEMDFGAIAGQLQINPSTVRVQYTRGITKLKTYLNKKMEQK